MARRPRPPKRPKPKKLPLLQRIRNNFLTGLIVVAPIFLTIYLIWLFVSFIDDRVVPLIPARYNPEVYLNADIPGFGVVVFLIVCSIIGMLTKGIFGRQLVRFGESLVDRTPVVRSIYNAVKQIIETIFSQSQSSFQNACLVQYPREGILISAGVLGFGAIVDLWPAFPVIMRYAGAAFLIGYALMRFFAAWNGSGQIEAKGHSQPLAAAVLTCLALTWLNPHVYLDTLGLIGAISTQFESGPEKTAFGIGAISASFVFFFSLGYGARLLAPVMRSARAWQILDLLIGVLMLWLAYLLISGH